MAGRPKTWCQMRTKENPGQPPHARNGRWNSGAARAGRGEITIVTTRRVDNAGQRKRFRTETETEPAVRAPVCVTNCGVPRFHEAVSRYLQPLGADIRGERHPMNR